MKHIDSIATSGIPLVNKADFYTQCMVGDLVFCQGNYESSKIIEKITKSPLSHIFMIWLANSSSTWLTLEATFEKGVHVGLLSDYVDRYNGSLVLTHRPILTTSEVSAELDAGLLLLDNTYDIKEEISIAGRKLTDKFPLIKPKNEDFCSALQYVMSLVTTHPLQKTSVTDPTPEDNWTDPTVVAKCAYIPIK